jgi:hypothetical protein
MSDDRRIVNYFFDVELGVPVLSASDRSKDPEKRMYYPGTQVVHRAHLLLHDGTYFKPPATATWSAAIDKIPTAGQGDLVYSGSEYDDFNKAEDWTGVDGVAPTSGKICWRSDFTDEKFKTLMSAATDVVEYWFCLWMNSPVVGYDLKCQWKIDCMPVAFDPSIAKKNPGAQHVTLGLANASYIPLWGDGYRFRVRNKELSLHFPDDKWATLVPKIVDGKRDFDFIDDPED